MLYYDLINQTWAVVICRCTVYCIRKHIGGSEHNAYCFWNQVSMFGSARVR